MDKPLIQSSQESVLKGNQRHFNHIVNLALCITIGKSTSNGAPSIVFTFGENHYVHWVYLDNEHRDLDLAHIMHRFSNPGTRSRA
jgi:hypothetical protein